MDIVGRITILDEPLYQGRYRVVQIECRPFSLGDIFTVVDKSDEYKSDEYNVVLSPVEGIHRCYGCALKPNSSDNIMDCSCCTEDGWFPCVGVRPRKFFDVFIFKPTSELMEEL